MTTTPEAK